MFFQASGDANKEIHIRNPETMEKIKVFRGHRNTVSVSYSGRKNTCIYNIYVTL